MIKDYKKMFKSHTGHLVANEKLYKNLRLFRLRWMNKNMIHVEFLSSNLIGVHPIRFTKDDEDEFFDDLLDVDKKDLQKDLHKTKGVYKDRKVSSNVTYNTCMYLINMFMESSLKKDIKESAIKEIFLIMTYKMFSSLMSHNFTHDLDVDVANTVYEKLSRRYLIKQLGSWEAVFEYRSNDVLCNDGLHCKRLKKLDGKNAGEVIADIQGRYRSIFKELYSVISEVLDNNEKRLSRSLNASDVEGNDVVADVTNLNKDYFTYMDRIIFKKNDFIKEDIISIIDDMFKNVSTKDLRTVLEHISDTYLTDTKRIKLLVEHSLKANINYLHVSKMNPPYDLRIISVVRHLKGFWSSSKVKDKNLLKAKQLVYDISKEATKKETRWITISLGMSVSVYIFLRAVLKSSYK